jgi:predicted HTH transcriptional regulator
MADEQLLHVIASGESKTVEFKLELPGQSEKYVKTLVAYANTAGGKLIVGVRDRDRTIIGVPDPVAVIDTIANALTDTVAPLIIPNIYQVDVDGKALVVAEVFPGTNCPYYIKSKGKAGGTYVKIGATTRLADESVLRELEFRGASQSFDEQVYIGAPYDEGKAKELCEVINNYRKEAARAKGRPKPTNRVTPKNLENWKIVRRVDGGLVPTRAFMLLTDNPFDFAKIQCAQFKGTDRIVFLDKREYAGALYEQIEEATQFVLRNIRFGAEIIGMLRHEDYELPLTGIREAIINAVIHRSYLQNSCVQVALYDDRLEVSSPGALFGDLTLEKALAGSTAVRNTRIAKAFEEMELYESWGTGLRRIKDSCKSYGLPEPEFLEIGDMFRVNIFRVPASQPASEADVKQVVNRNSLVRDPALLEREILSLLTQNPKYSRKELAEKTGVSESSIYRRLTVLRSAGRIEFVGTNRSGKWVIKE